VRPDLIFLNMPVFESSGTRQRWGAIGNHINALAGVNGISGLESDPPFGLGPLYPDFSGNPFHAAAAILSALVERDRGAGAQMIEVSQYESTISILGPALMLQSATGRNPARRGSRSDRSCPHNVYPAAGEDQWIAVEVATDGQWLTLCRVLDNDAWSGDPRFATIDARRSNEEALDELIAAQTAFYSASELAGRLQTAGIGASPVNHLGDLLADPWYPRRVLHRVERPRRLPLHDSQRADTPFRPQTTGLPFANARRAHRRGAARSVRNGAAGDRRALHGGRTRLTRRIGCREGGPTAGC